MLWRRLMTSSNDDRPTGSLGSVSLVHTDPTSQSEAQNEEGLTNERGRRAQPAQNGDMSPLVFLLHSLTELLYL